MTDDRVRPTPRGAVRAAIRRAFTYARRVGGILAVGEGYKHTGDDYLESGVLCVKFLVRRKVATPDKAIPASIVVRWRGQEYVVATDVEELGDAEPQSLECWASMTPEDRGTVGAFVAGAGGELLALTAGHVLTAGANSGLPSSQGLRVTIGGQELGTIRGDGTALSSSAGTYMDIGTVALDSLPNIWLQQLPWSAMERVVQAPQLWRKFKSEGGHPSRGLVAGAEGTPIVFFDALWREAYPWNGLQYAAPILGYRVEVGALAGGYSGSAVTDISGREWLGVHVLGSESYGYAQASGLLLGEVEDAIGSSLSLCRP